jgi:hypothetical protein
MDRKRYADKKIMRIKGCKKLKNSLQFSTGFSFPMLMSSFGIFCQLENPTKINPLPLTSYHTTHKEEQANVWNTYSTAQYLSFHPTHEEEQLRKAHILLSFFINLLLPCPGVSRDSMGSRDDIYTV